MQIFLNLNVFVAFGEHMGWWQGSAELPCGALLVAQACACSAPLPVHRCHTGATNASSTPAMGARPRTVTQKLYATQARASWLALAAC